MTMDLKNSVGFKSSPIFQNVKMLEVATLLKHELKSVDISVGVIWGKEEKSWRFYCWDPVTDLQYSPLVCEYMIVESKNEPAEWSELIACDILDSFERGEAEHIKPQNVIDFP